MFTLKPSHSSRFLLVLAIQLAFSLAGIAAVAETDVPGGDVFGTWTADASPYLVHGNIAVPTDSILTIESGVDVIFQGGYGLTVHGIMNAEGTEADSIRFTATSSWHGITFGNAVDASQVCYTVFSDPTTVTLDCSNSSPAISHCRISDGGFAGILVNESGNPVITHSTISDSGIGIWWYSPANGIISNCVIASSIVCSATIPPTPMGAQFSA
jgi:parallel beta-helix repeat protein